MYLESLACNNWKCELIGRLGQDNLTLTDDYFGRAEEVKSRREEIKQATARGRCIFTFNIVDFLQLFQAHPEHHGLVLARLFVAFLRTRRHRDEGAA